MLDYRVIITAVVNKAFCVRWDGSGGFHPLGRDGGVVVWFCDIAESEIEGVCLLLECGEGVCRWTYCSWGLDMLTCIGVRKVEVAIVLIDYSILVSAVDAYGLVCCGICWETYYVRACALVEQLNESCVGEGGGRGNLNMPCPEAKRIWVAGDVGTNVSGKSLEVFVRERVIEVVCLALI